LEIKIMSVILMEKIDFMTPWHSLQSFRSRQDAVLACMKLNRNRTDREKKEGKKYQVNGIEY